MKESTDLKNLMISFFFFQSQYVMRNKSIIFMVITNLLPDHLEDLNEKGPLEVAMPKIQY